MGTASGTWTLVVVVFMHIGSVFAAVWTYSGMHGPDHWAATYPICGSNAQSPINIVTSTVKKESLGTFTFTGYNTKPSSQTLTNNGHSVVVSAVGTMTVSGGGLSGTRTVAQFHFHWGSSEATGSEHKIDGAQSPMEMHIVHYDAAYGSLGAALNKTNGLAVLGYLFVEDNDDNQAFNEIVKKLANVKASAATASLDPFTLDSLLPSNKKDFYRYDGSLTTPTCDQSVEWTIFKEKIKISVKQLDAFRNTQYTDGTKQVDNFRPVQDLNGRVVKATFAESSGALSQPTVVLMMMTAAAAILFIRY